MVSQYYSMAKGFCQGNNGESLPPLGVVHPIGEDNAYTKCYDTIGYDTNRASIHISPPPVLRSEQILSLGSLGTFLRWHTLSSRGHL